MYLAIFAIVLFKLMEYGVYDILVIDLRVNLLISF